MFLFFWNLPKIKWGVLLTETGTIVAKRLSQKIFGKQYHNIYTDAQVTHAADTVRQLGKCEPMSHNELDAGLISSICNKIKQGRELEARQAIQKAARPEAREWCIDALKAA